MRFIGGRCALYNVSTTLVMCTFIPVALHMRIGRFLDTHQAACLIRQVCDPINYANPLTTDTDKRRDNCYQRTWRLRRYRIGAGDLPDRRRRAWWRRRRRYDSRRGDFRGASCT